MPGAHLLGGTRAGGAHAGGRTCRRRRHLMRRRHNTFRSKTIQSSRRKAFAIASCIYGVSIELWAETL
jgi:hypothetical protein